MKRFRGIIYVDYYIEDEEAEDHNKKSLAAHYLTEDTTGIENAIAGGVVPITGDLLTDAKALEGLK